MPFNFQAIPDVGVPLDGFFPQARQVDPRAYAQAAWLNRGGRAAPARPAPSIQDLNQWTDEDHQIAVMSGADPLGVREAFERYRGQQDEQAFIEGLGQIDWKDPGSKSQVAQLISKNPRGVTQKGLGIMQLLDKLEGTEKDTYRPQVAELGTDYLNAYDTAVKSGKDRDTALAEVSSMRHKNTLADKAKVDVRNKFVEAGGDLDKFEELSGKYGTDWAGYRDYLNKNKPLAKLEAAERKALTEAYGTYQQALQGLNQPASEEDVKALDARKVAAFTKVNGRPPATTEEWAQAYNLVKSEMVNPALAQLSDLVDLYEGKAIPEAVTRLVRPTSTQSPTAAPMSVPAPSGAPAPHGVPVPAVPAPASPEITTEPAVSQADLKRIEPVTFESLASQVARAGETRKREAAAVETRKREEQQRIVDINVPRWEEAKMSLLSQFSPEYLKFRSEPQIKTMLAQMGKKWNDKAFDDASGSPVSWLEVGYALQQDPRMEQLRKDPKVAAPSIPLTTPQQQQYKANLPRAVTKEQVYALKPGEQYIDANGNVRTRSGAVAAQ
jgi:hypothetical protein